MIRQILHDGWQIRQAGTSEWLTANVPGGVFSDLISANRIPNPFWEDNELTVQWVVQADWEYRLSFIPNSDLTDEGQISLVCDGLDTIAEISLNGQTLGKTDNMFRSYAWQVKHLLQSGPNELIIKFLSSTNYCASRHAQRVLRMSDDALPGASYLRKAPYQFGWDWGPKLPEIGIWKPVQLVGFSTARLDDIQIRQLHQPGSVRLSASITTRDWEASDLHARIRVSHPSGSLTQDSVTLNKGNGELAIDIAKPELWWPNGYGPQPLYNMVVTLESGKSVIDSRSYQIGLRKIELRQMDDRWGRSFTFVINDVPIFAKGANWIPSDSFPSHITDEHMECLVASAAAANHNMLRCWGGGYYETDKFYELCDHYGILVWQDFMFACAIYPLNEQAFIDNVHEEVKEVVHRLKHHACLVLWCGNNEIEAGWAHWGWSRQDTQDLQNADQEFFYGTLPAWLKSLDPDRPYWPSSPSSHLPHQQPGSDFAGDNHLWEVWHGLKPITSYREQFPRFASEFGMQSLPALTTIAEYADPADWNMTSYVMEHHQRSLNGNSRIIHYLTEQFRIPKDFPSLVYLSQVVQAEAMRTGVEHWRRNPQRCSGALYWQLNDCWPVASWSSIDYFGRWKALHYASKRFYAPVLLSIDDNPDRIQVHVTNDTVTSWQGEVRWFLESVDGEVIQSGKRQVDAAPLASNIAASIRTKELKVHALDRKLVFVAELRQGSSRLALAAAPISLTKHLELKEPGIETRISLKRAKLCINLQASSLARFVKLDLEGKDVIFSDNYFDLPAGRQVEVTCPLPEGWTLDQAQDALKIYSLYDSYTVS